jgi:hypothetical protein
VACLPNCARMSGPLPEPPGSFPYRTRDRCPQGCCTMLRDPTGALPAEPWDHVRGGAPHRAAPRRALGPCPRPPRGRFAELACPSRTHLPSTPFAPFGDAPRRTLGPCARGREPPVQAASAGQMHPSGVHATPFGCASRGETASRQDTGTVCGAARGGHTLRVRFAGEAVRQRPPVRLTHGKGRRAIAEAQTQWTTGCALDAGPVVDELISVRYRSCLV